MWENGNRKTAILTTVLLASALIIGLIGLPQLAWAQDAVVTEQTAANDENALLENEAADAASATTQLTAYRRAISYRNTWIVSGNCPADKEIILWQ